MRIAFFSTLDNAPWGGCEVLWQKTALYLKREGFEIVCFVKRWPQDPPHIIELRQHGIEIYYYQAHKKTLNKKVFAKIQRHLRIETNFLKSLFNWEPDYVIFSQGHTYDLAYFNDKTVQALLHSKLKFSIICQNNTDYSYIPGQQLLNNISELFKKAISVMFVSERNRESAILHLCESFKNFKIISNSLSFSIEDIGIVPFSENPIIQFASVANLKCSHKGQNILLHVFSQSKWQQRNWVLNLYGKGENEVYLKKLTAFLGLEDKVVFWGHVSDIKKVWEKNHLLLLASFGEGLPLAIQEAMLCGRPVLATDVGGNAEFVKEGFTGFLAEGTTFSAIDHALERAWNSRDKWRDMGINAFNMSKDKIDLRPEETILMEIKENLGAKN